MRVFRYLLYFFLFIVLAIGAFVAFLEIRGIPKYEVEQTTFPAVQGDSTGLARGAIIASLQCNFCHMGSDGKLSGRLVTEIPTYFGHVHSANITQSKENGIGSWTDAQIVYFLRTGVKPTGQYVPIYMPKYIHMSDDDIRGVLSFLHSNNPVVQPSEIPAVPCQPSLLTKFLCLVAFKKIPYPTAPVVVPDTNNLVAYGKYLVTGRYDCYPCHSADFKTVNMAAPETTPGYMGGGNTLITRSGQQIFSANITPDEKTGIGNWTEEDFRLVMLRQKNKDGRPVRQPMLPFNQLTDLEIKAIYKYLMTLPPIKNEVNRQWDNAEL